MCGKSIRVTFIRVILRGNFLLLMSFPVKTLPQLNLHLSLLSELTMHHAVLTHTVKRRITRQQRGCAAAMWGQSQLHGSWHKCKIWSLIQTRKVSSHLTLCRYLQIFRGKNSPREELFIRSGGVQWCFWHWGRACLASSVFSWRISVSLNHVSDHPHGHPLGSL